MMLSSHINTCQKSVVQNVASVSWTSVVPSKSCNRWGEGGVFKGVGAWVWTRRIWGVLHFSFLSFSFFYFLFFFFLALLPLLVLCFHAFLVFFLSFLFSFVLFRFLLFPVLSSIFFSFLCFFSPIDLRLSCVCVVIDTTCNIYVVVFLGCQSEFIVGFSRRE